MIDSQWVFPGFAGFTAFMALFIYPMSLRHVGLCAILLILLCWKGMEAGDRATFAFRVWLAACAVSGIVNAIYIASVGFDSSRAIADYIEQQPSSAAISIAAFDPSLALPVAAALGRPHYDLRGGCQQTFLRLAEKDGRDAQSYATLLAQAVDDVGQLYVLSETPLTSLGGALEPLRLVKTFPRTFSAGPKHLYIAGASTSRRTTVQSCRPLD